MPAATNLTSYKKSTGGIELQNCFLRSFFLSHSNLNMRQSLFSFVVAALCVQKALSYPLDKRTFDGMNNILKYYFILRHRSFYSRYRHSQLRTYSWTSWKCILLRCSSQIRRQSFSRRWSAIFGPCSLLGGRCPWGGACGSPECCFGR